jgi:hypothetical protein
VKPVSIVSEGTMKNKLMQETMVVGKIFIWVM